MLNVLKDLFRYDRRFAFGFTVVCILIFLAILSFFCPYNLKLWNVVPRDLPPSFKYPLGTNSLGQDVFWKATAAIRNSLAVALVAAGLSRVIAIIIGLIAGYKGGSTDRVVMSVNDSFVVLPLLPILVLIASVLKGQMNIFIIGLILGIFGWAWDARLIRSQILSLRERQFTQTAVLSGMRTSRLVFKEHLPFVIPLIFAATINNIIFVIGMEIVLSAFGLTSLETPTLGTMIHWSVNYQAMLLGYWWWVLTPIFLCVFLIFSLYMVSTSISEFLDPRSRLQRIKIGG